MEPDVPPPSGPSPGQWQRMGWRVTIAGIVFTTGAVAWLAYDGMAWRTAVFVMLPFAVAAAAFGWIFHAKKDRSLVWLCGIWGVVVLATVLVTSCSGK